MAESYGTQQMSSESMHSEGSSFFVVARLLGAALSLALATSVGVWAYKLIIRDVSGIPVIAASKEPMRIAPEDPGGTSAKNQGLSVNAVAEEGFVPDPQRVTLAPRPIILVTDDLTSNELKEKATAALRVAEVDAIKPDMNALADTIANNETETDDGTSTVDGDQVENALRQALNSDLQKTLIEKNAQNGNSLRPRARPVYVSPVPSSAEVANVSEIAPENIPAGTALVQLGAFESAAIARSEWRRLSQKFPSFMAERARVIQRADRGGRVFYRLRANGFDDLNDARRFCALLVANNADCIPVTIR